jgi:hypothetical protein
VVDEADAAGTPSTDYWGDEIPAAVPKGAASSSQLWGGRSADGTPMAGAVDQVDAVVAVEKARLPPPMIDKPDPMLVAVVADDEADAAPGGRSGDYAEVKRAVGALTDSGGPRFVGTGPAPTPVGPPGLNSDLKDLAPTTAPGTFMAAWSLTARTKMRRSQRAARNRKRALRALVVLLLGVGAYLAYPFVHTQIVARSVAADLRPYVAGKGVAYAPTGGGYAVRLPAAPVRADRQLVAPTIPIAMLTHASTVTGSDYKIVVWVGDLPGGVLPKGLLGALKDPEIGGTGTLTGVHQANLAGETASIGSFASSDALPRRVAVLVHAGHLYVIRVQAQTVGPVFDRLTKSFRFTLPG